MSLEVILGRKRRDGTTSCLSLCPWPHGACLECAAGQVGLMQRATAGCPVPSDFVSVGWWNNLAVGRQGLCSHELSLFFLSTVLGGLDENCLVKKWKNSSFSMVKRLASFKNIYFSPQIINIFNAENIHKDVTQLELIDSDFQLEIKAKWWFLVSW